jgi:hypothetical protein
MIAKIGQTCVPCGTHHLCLHRIIEYGPSLLQLWTKSWAQLLLQAPQQCLTERNEIRFPHAKLRVLAAGMADDGLEHLALIERPDDRRDRIHQLEFLLVHIVGEQAPCIGHKLEKSPVELRGELLTEWPQRVERFPDQVDLLGRHDEAHPTSAPRELGLPARRRCPRHRRYPPLDRVRVEAA